VNPLNPDGFRDVRAAQSTSVIGKSCAELRGLRDVPRRLAVRLPHLTISDRDWPGRCLPGRQRNRSRARRLHVAGDFRQRELGDAHGDAGGFRDPPAGGSNFSVGGARGDKTTLKTHRSLKIILAL